MPVITPAQMPMSVTPAGPGGETKQAQRIGEPGGLTQFGACIETLPPGASSSIKHWHTGEDEMVYVLAGEVTLLEGDTETVLHAGDAATFKAGVPVGHCLVNRSGADVRCLVVGTRAAADQCTYPDEDCVMHRDGPGAEVYWTDGRGVRRGSPYVSWGTT